MSVSTITPMICGIISFKDYTWPEIPFAELEEFFKSTCKQYAFAVHDQDFNEYGEEETLHVHFVADLNYRSRIGTTINRMAKAIHVNPFAITMSRYTSFLGAFKYLIHNGKGQEAKHQYPKEAIFTNIPNEEVDLMLSQDDFVLDVDSLIDIVRHAEFKADVFAKIGLFYAKNYRGLINDLWLEFHGRPQA